MLTDFSMFVTELKEIDSRYYKVVLLTEFGTFVTEMEGTRFYVLHSNIADTIWQIVTEME